MPDPESHQYSFPLRVRYSETDPQRFVFNSRYLEYADVAMTEFFRSLGWGYPELIAEGCDPSLVQTTVRFTAPARLDDLLTIAVRCTRLGTTSFDLAIDVSRDGERLCDIASTYVNVDIHEGRAAPMPKPVAETLRSLVGGAPPISE